MKHPDDVKTVDMLGEPKRGRGRPLTAESPRTVEEKRKAAASRQRKRRELLKAQGVQAVTVMLPLDAVAGLNKFVKFKDISKDVVIAKLVRSQLMRER